MAKLIKTLKLLFFAIFVISLTPLGCQSVPPPVLKTTVVLPSISDTAMAPEAIILESEDVKIVGIENCYSTVRQGDFPTLPTHLKVYFSDNTSIYDAVTWDTINKYKYQTVGTFVVTGTLSNYKMQATCVVTVEPFRDLGYEIIRDDTYTRNVITVNNSDYTIPTELANKIYSTISSYGLNVGFNVISLKDYTTISYNADDDFRTASVVKAPYALYCFKEIEKGNASLDDILTYQTKFWEKGCGIIKSFPAGSQFTFSDVIYNTLHISDNSGYYMMIDHCGRDGYIEMVESLGCKATSITKDTRWGTFSPHDLSVIWNEIYNYSFNCKEGEEFLQMLVDAEFNFVKEAIGTYEKVAHKSGFNDKGYHDAAIVFGDSDPNAVEKTNDYIVVIMSKTEESMDPNDQLIRELAREIDEIMKDLTAYQNKAN